MPFVYRYRDKTDNKVKYVGIVYGNKLADLDRRIDQHTRDPWYDNTEWTIDFIVVATRNDAEAIEAHLIAAYHTDRYYNKAKTSWGMSSFINIDESMFVVYSRSDPLIGELVRRGLREARSKGRQIGRPCLTAETLPENFVNVYPAYKDGMIKKITLSRMVGVSRPTLDKYIALMEEKHDDAL